MAMSRGRHRRPSKTSKVIAKSSTTAAVGAVAASAVAASPHGLHTVKPEPVHVTAYITHAVPVKTAAATIMVVNRGDTLSKIAAAHCGQAGDWTGIYSANEKTIGTNPDLIEPGQKLALDCAVTTVDVVVPHSHWHHLNHLNHLAQEQPADPAPVTHTDPPAAKPVQETTVSDGQYSCSSLESLWEQAGGSPGTAFMAAEIAMAESGGNPNATHDDGGSQDEGLWQINTTNGALSTYSPLGSAQSAVQLSSDGSDWSSWVTYQQGMENGQC